MSYSFQPFDPRADLDISRRNLPHWQQPGATYFVTFRLADSLPAEVCARLEEMRQLNKSDALAWIDRYLDAGTGRCLLRTPANAAVVAAALRHFDGQRYHLGYFVIMPNHVHALVTPVRPSTLSSILHSWKSYSANRLQRAIGSAGRIWQEESFDRLVRHEDELAKFRAYIQDNPASAHLGKDEFVLGTGTAIDSRPHP